MKSIVSQLLAALAATLMALPAAAQGPGGPGGSMPKGRTDCSKARNPAQCEARQKAAEACQGRRGAEHRQCMHDHMPPVDCGKAGDPQRCEQHKQAWAACQDKTGPDFRACMREKMGPPAKPAAPGK